MKVFAVYSEQEKGYWNDEMGWTEHLDFATKFTNSETITNRLPNIGVPDAEWHALSVPPAIQALLAFVSTVDACGGLVPADCDGADKGLLAPAGDPEWVDLGDAYIEACKVLNRKPALESAKRHGCARRHPKSRRKTQNLGLRR